ncbi:hypothetical protein ACH47Z_02820 [Streptomyces sp. NPDC020192]
MGDEDLPVSVSLVSRAHDAQPPDPLRLLPATLVTLLVGRSKQDCEV